MEKTIRLSVVLAVKNEANNIARCLDSIKSIADEIVIVDGGSSDNTIEISEKFGSRIIKTDSPPIFHINKQKALDAAKGEWILQLDADEIVSPRLLEEIRVIISMTDSQIKSRFISESKLYLFNRHQSLVEKRDGKIGGKENEITAFFVPRLNYFLGGPIIHAGTYPDGVIRLVKNGKARFPAKSVHEQIITDGQVAWLTNDLIHLSNPTVKKYLQSANIYTDLMADELRKKLHSLSVKEIMEYFVIKPIGTFINLYIRHKGILDGWRGFLFCLFSGCHFPVIMYKFLFVKNDRII
jgi:glycosyltransferase involved in cell wall biosynthesis